MNSSTDLYDGFAEMLTYPDGNYYERAQRCGRILDRVHPELMKGFTEFAGAVAARSVEELEELFTQTFDLNPACCLEVGWHLFGENYERGRVLVKMRQELERAGLQESGELPDHLTHVLRVLTRIEPERAAGLVVDGVLPALDKMMDALKDQENPYEALLRIIQIIVQEAVPHQPEVAHD